MDCIIAHQMMMMYFIADNLMRSLIRVRSTKRNKWLYFLTTWKTC